MGKLRTLHEPLRLGGHYKMSAGQLVLIDPQTTTLPLRCKLALAELKTGLPHAAVQKAVR